MRSEGRIKKLFNDSRYQQALKMLSDRANAAAEARANLKVMIATIVAQQQQAA